MKILIIGAKSDIAKAVAHEYAKNGHDMVLACRNAKESEIIAKDIHVRYNVHATCMELDVTKFATHAAFVKKIESVDGVVCVAGYLGEQKKSQEIFEETLKTIHTNYVGCVSILNYYANIFEEKKNGFIIGVSSVAGDRGRGSNYIYGSAKAGFTAYLSGLRNRLSKSNVQVLTVKPGFVNTQMTAGMKLPKLLTAQPEEVATSIFRAQKANKNVLYVKWMWKYIMLIISLIPESIFKKLKL